MTGPPSILTQWAAGDLPDAFRSIYALSLLPSSPKPELQMTLTEMCFTIRPQISLSSDLNHFYQTRCLTMKSISFNEPIKSRPTIFTGSISDFTWKCQIN